MAKKPILLEQAAKEVTSDIARREIGVTRIAFKEMQKLIVAISKEEDVIFDAISICDAAKCWSVSERLKRMLK